MFSLSDLSSSFKEFNLIVTFYIENKNSNKLEKLKNSGVPILMFVNSKSFSLLNSLYSVGNVKSKNKVQEVTTFLTLILKNLILLTVYNLIYLNLLHYQLFLENIVCPHPLMCWHFRKLEFLKPRNLLLFWMRQLNVKCSYIW